MTLLPTIVLHSGPSGLKIPQDHTCLVCGVLIVFNPKNLTWGWSKAINGKDLELLWKETQEWFHWKALGVNMGPWILDEQRFICPKCLDSHFTQARKELSL